MASSYFMNTPLHKYQHSPFNHFRGLAKEENFKSSMFRSTSQSEKLLNRSNKRKINNLESNLSKYQYSQNYGSTGHLLEKIQQKINNLKQPRAKSTASDQYIEGPSQSYLLNNNKRFFEYQKPSSQSGVKPSLLNIQKINKTPNLKQEITRSLSKLSRVSKKIYEDRKHQPLFTKNIFIKESTPVSKSRVNKNYFENVREAGIQRNKKVSDRNSNNNPYGLYYKNKMY